MSRNRELVNLKTNRYCQKHTPVSVGTGGGVFSRATYWYTTVWTEIEGLPSQTGFLAVHCRSAISSCVTFGPEQLRK